ncbi:hypothetical protein JCM3775_001129 [Rhodotorula graminis]
MHGYTASRLAATPCAALIVCTELGSPIPAPIYDGVDLIPSDLAIALVRGRDLVAFHEKGYENEIGPGLYDIHSPRVPSVEEMKGRLDAYLKALPAQKHIWVNPDCGLKTRAWPETEQSLKNMVEVAKLARAERPE